MRIVVKAKPSAHEESVEKTGPVKSAGADHGAGLEHFTVSVTEPPVQGMANKAIIRALAAYFKVAPSQVRLVSGFSSRQKIFEIND